MSGDAEDYSPQSCQVGLKQLATLFQDAAAILDAAVRAEANVEAPIVCLPQTLDLRSSSRPGSRHFGFSPGDTQNPEPYFYVCSGVAKNSQRTLVKAHALIAEADPAAAAAKLKTLANAT